MINHRSLVCTGALALLMTAPASAWQGEGRDHGPGYQIYSQSGGGDQGGGRDGGSQEGGSSGGQGSGWVGGGGGGGGSGTSTSGSGGGTGVSHSAPGPELGVGLPALIFGGYLWYRRRANQRRKISGESQD
jgi:hypothetical protein